MANPPRILRLAAPSRLVSAQVFERLFDTHHGQWFSVTRQDHREFFTRILAPDRAPESLAPDRFREAAEGFDFICPGFQSTLLIPQILDLRNRSGAAVRLLFINHSPAVFAYVFGLLPGLIRPGDLIVAPSPSAAGVIRSLSPALAPHIRTIHHPMALPKMAGTVPKSQKITLVTLGRLVPDKLIHIQIQALGLLRETYGRDANLVVAGETRNLDTGEPSVYTRSLAAITERLGLSGHVSFPGVIRDPAAKAELLARAHLMLYLSQTLEEAFPKGAVEGLMAGLPVVAARWNGFADIIGNCGRLVPFHPTASGALDLTPEAVARAMDDCLASPPLPEACRIQASRFSPERSRTGYSEALTQALDFNPRDGAEPETGKTMADLTGPGLLAGLPFFAGLSFGTALDEYRVYAGHIRRSWEKGAPQPPSDPGFQTDRLMAMALRKQLEYRYAGLPFPEPHAAAQECRSDTIPFSMDPASIQDRMARTAMATRDRDTATACLLQLMDQDRPDRVQEILDHTDPETFPRTAGYARAWLSCREGKADQALDLFITGLNPSSFLAHEWPLLRLLDLIREQGGPADTIARILKDWLDRYPDSPGSGLVWLDLAAAHGQSLGWDASQTLGSLARAERLLGDLDAVRQLKARTMAAALAREDAGSLS